MLGSIGSVGDAFDNAMAESFVDSFKTGLIADRVWRTSTQLELAIVEWVGWFNSDRLHDSLNDTRPPSFKLYAATNQTITSTVSVDWIPPTRFASESARLALHVIST